MGEKKPVTKLTCSIQERLLGRAQAARYTNVSHVCPTKLLFSCLLMLEIDNRSFAAPSFAAFALLHAPVQKNQS